eukprot:1937616-Prymnesium_polylepis.1
MAGLDALAAAAAVHAMDVESDADDELEPDDSADAGLLADASSSGLSEPSSNNKARSSGDAARREVEDARSK